MTARRAIILPVVLVLIGILAMVMAGFTYFVRAEVTGAEARRDQQQARLAAESGLQAVIVALRQSRDDFTQWWDRPDRFRHVLVWSDGYTQENDPVRENGSREQLLSDPSAIVPAWRFSIVAAKDDGLPDTMRYGITPEASKLNLNSASDDEITRLLEPLLNDMGLENAPELIAALLDWRDADDEPRPNGAESDYYNTLDPGYYAKNGKFATVEELLWVKGFSAAVLYGEDVNRNGILDLNEDDGDASFPEYDNGDGILQRGIAPYLTVWSQEPGQNNQPLIGRVNVNTAPIQVLQALDGMTPEMADQIIADRQELDAEALSKPDWPLTSGAIDAASWETLKDKLTTVALQFHVEAVGYADHLKIVQRHEWILEMRGPIAQVLYHRDLTRLGFAWPIDDDTVVVETPSE